MKVKLGQWQKRDGTTIQIKDMDDDHLMKAINMCVQNSPRIKRLLVRYLESLAWSAFNYSCDADTPDGASMAADQEGNFILQQAIEIENSQDIMLTNKGAELVRAAYSRGLTAGVPVYKILESFI